MMEDQRGYYETTIHTVVPYMALAYGVLSPWTVGYGRIEKDVLELAYER